MWQENKIILKKKKIRLFLTRETSRYHRSCGAMCAENILKCEMCSFNVDGTENVPIGKHTSCLVSSEWFNSQSPHLSTHFGFCFNYSWFKIKIRSVFEPSQFHLQLPRLQSPRLPFFFFGFKSLKSDGWKLKRLNWISAEVAREKQIGL